jgi:hypothetical protein
MKHIENYKIFESRHQQSLDSIDKAIKKSDSKKDKKMLKKVKKSLVKIDKKNKKKGIITLGDLYDRIDLIKSSNYVEEDGVRTKMTKKYKEDRISEIEDIIEDSIKKDYPNATFERETKRKRKKI